jgi:hypothetical protein
MTVEARGIADGADNQGTLVSVLAMWGSFGAKPQKALAAVLGDALRGKGLQVDAAAQSSTDPGIR